MSDFVVVINKDRSPCDRDLVNHLTQTMAHRGPDGCFTETIGHVGLGAALFHSTAESAGEHQPITINGSWIVGDVRLDDRARLVENLIAQGFNTSADDADLQLTLQAFLAWGDDCVQRLMGEFAFAVWDQHRERLLAARDHFGVHPFFYADSDNCVVISNNLQCIRQHPDIGQTLNESYIADFLLFGEKTDPSSTPFREILRLPSAHILNWTRDKSTYRRYWELPCYTEPLALRNPLEYIERFKAVLRASVADRLRMPAISLELTGGLDSTCVAATVMDLIRSGDVTADVQAWTCVSPKALPSDHEVEFASIAADALGIRHRIFNLDDYPLYGFRSGDFTSPVSELRDLSFHAPGVDFIRAIGEHSRVLLTGQGGDGIFRGSPLHFQRLLKKGRFAQVFSETIRYIFQRRKLPPFGLRSKLKRQFRMVPRVPQFPAWIRPELAEQFDLKVRWENYYDARPKFGPDLRQEAAKLMRQSWEQIFDSYEESTSAVDCRHPLFDLRVVNFLLQIPPLPWLADKDLVRMTWTDSLPRQIRERPKTPLQGDLLAGRRFSSESEIVETALQLVSPYVDIATLKQAGEFPIAGDWRHHSILSLGLWMNELSADCRRMKPVTCATMECPGISVGKAPIGRSVTSGQKSNQA